MLLGLTACESLPSIVRIEIDGSTLRFEKKPDTPASNRRRTMTARAERVVASARALIGVRFRPQGRSPASGLDCVGLVAAAIDARDAPRDYALRGGSMARLAAALAAAGLRPAAAARAGDVLVLAPGPAQLHLGIFTGGGLVHGDAGLRRVVERPGPAPWPILSIWRIGED